MAHPQLLEDVRDRLEAGDTPEKVYGSLQKKGWSTEDITGALALLSLKATHFNVAEQLDEVDEVRRAKTARHNDIMLRILVLVLFIGGGAAVVRATGLTSKITSFVSTFKEQQPSTSPDGAPILINDYGVYGNYPSSSPDAEPGYTAAPVIKTTHATSHASAPAHNAPAPAATPSPAEPTPDQQEPYTPPEDTAPAYTPSAPPSNSQPPGGPPIFIPD